MEIWGVEKYDVLISRVFGSYISSEGKALNNINMTAVLVKFYSLKKEEPPVW